VSGSSRALLLAAAAMAAVACSPQSINLRELSPYEFSVAVNAKAMQSCVSEARRRAEKEAASYCGAHGRQMRPGITDRQGSDQTGCRVELVFGCALPRQ
jgi:hypothetical protein